MNRLFKAISIALMVIACSTPVIAAPCGKGNCAVAYKSCKGRKGTPHPRAQIKRYVPEVQPARPTGPVRNCAACRR